MKIKVLALDLDGTLTNSKKEITSYTKCILEQAMEEGVKLVLASGRPEVGIWPLAKELELNQYGGYILSYNGGKIIDCMTGTDLYANVLPMDCIPVLCDTAKKHGVSILSYRGTEVITDNAENVYVQKECFINKTKAHQVSNLTEALTVAPAKCLIVGEHEELLPVRDELQAIFKDQLNIFFSEPFFLEVVPNGVEKAASLGRLLSILDVTKEELMACGDGLNDLTMLDFAGLSVAMGNACKEALERADVVTATNDEDGVAKAVKQYILSKADQAV